MQSIQSHCIYSFCASHSLIWRYEPTAMQYNILLGENVSH